MQLQQLKREDFDYQAAYCEENIWHLSRRLSQLDPHLESYAMFIFSQGDAFPMQNQRASEHPELPIFWDYHVVLAVVTRDVQIFDFDTTLPFMTPIEDYFSYSFMDEALLIQPETPLFRLVPATEYIALFSSDRSHMRTQKGWFAPPPSWPTIGNNGTNLTEFTQAKDNRLGEVLTQNAVLSRFTETTKKVL